MQEKLNPRVHEYFARDDAASQWWQGRLDEGGRNGKQIEFLRANVDARDKEVLDLATGTGRFAICYALGGAMAVTAVDIAEQMVKNAKANAEQYGVMDKIQFRVSNLFDVDFPDASFDIVNFMEAMVHVPQPDEVIAKLARLVKPGGYVVTNFDYPYTDVVAYPLNTINALWAGIRSGDFFGSRSKVKMLKTVEDTVTLLDSQDRDPSIKVSRPWDAYRGLPSKLVHRWIEDAGLEVVTSLREYPGTVVHIPVPIPIGKMLICRRSEGTG